SRRRAERGQRGLHGHHGAAAGLCGTDRAGCGIRDGFQQVLSRQHRVGRSGSGALVHLMLISTLTPLGSLRNSWVIPAPGTSLMEYSTPCADSRAFTPARSTALNAT